MPTWLSPNWQATYLREPLIEIGVDTELSILNPNDHETAVTLNFFDEFGRLAELYSGTWPVGPRNCLVHRAAEPEGTEYFPGGWLEVTSDALVIPAGRIRSRWRRVSEGPLDPDSPMPVRTQTLANSARVMVFYQKEETGSGSPLSRFMRTEERWLSAEWRGNVNTSPDVRLVGETTIVVVHFGASPVEMDVTFFDRGGARVEEFSGRWAVPPRRAFSIFMDPKTLPAAAEGFGWFEIRSMGRMYPTAFMRLGESRAYGEGGAADTILLERRSRLVWFWEPDPPVGRPPVGPPPTPHVPGTDGKLDPRRPPEFS